jgi:FAD/FMN-containing dehydrogenase
MPDTRGLIDRQLEADLAAVTGPAHVLVDSDLRRPYEVDWTRRFSGPSRMVVRPGTVAEVSQVIRLLAGRDVPLVLQGGNTGLVGGSVPGQPDPGRGAPVILSTSRLSGLGPVDSVSAQVTAGAGVTLARLQAAAHSAGLAFPVDLAARDSATVGGMIATNAGGLHVLRYGPMRAQVLGVEAVLADGTVISRLSGLVKDNTGYDLSQLVVGSEGTLAVVTAARLRLVGEKPQRIVVLFGLPDTTSALAVVDIFRRKIDGFQAAELFYDEGMELVIEHGSLSRPLADRHPCYLTVEIASLEDPTPSLMSALEDLDVPDTATAVAIDAIGAERLWAYRERHTETVSALGVPHKLDVTLPVSSLADFEKEVRREVASVHPGARLILWGHAGDGNLHVNVIGPAADDEGVDDAVLHLVASMHGSISAEHGIGRAKTRWLHLSRSDSEIATMRALKFALDPGDILNPGVLLTDQRLTAD